MKKTVLILISICIMLTFGSTFFACNEKEPSVPTDADDIANIDTVTESTLSFEWLREYTPNRPTLIYFHGEGETFFNLPTDVYTKDTLSEHIGIGGNGIRYNYQKTEIDLAYLWTNVFYYNVAIFHWEDFIESSLPVTVGKIFTVYNMRYQKNGKTETEAVIDCPLSTAVALLYLKEMERLQATADEIRFVGNGVGAVLAAAVSSSLALYYGDSDYLPYRLTLCDAPLTTTRTTYNDRLSFISLLTQCFDDCSSYGTAVEVIETKELNGSLSSFAYDTPSDRTEELAELKKRAAYLELTESYSLAPQFDTYKQNKRLALDWYLYSVVGSDDPTVGYPATESSNLSLSNRGNASTNPVLNDRKITNDNASVVTEKSSKNYGISAWTPTAYIRALRGISFTQQKATSPIADNIQGKATYLYTPYTLDKFSSENYQVSDMKDYSLFCGFLYFDKDNDLLMNDGIGSVRNGEMTLSVYTETESGDKEYLLSKYRFSVGKDGFFAVRFNDSPTDNPDASSDGNGTVTLSGILVTERSAVLSLSYVYEKGYTNYDTASYAGSYYRKMSGNGFTYNLYEETLCTDIIHTVRIANCLVRTL